MANLPASFQGSEALQRRRRHYAEEVCRIAGVHSAPLAEAFARVPREGFLRPPPWRIISAASHRPVSDTTDPQDLYCDVLLALKPELGINNGQPSLLAKLIDALALAPGKQAAHIGCGTGYYTAIMAELVGPQGSILAVEIDPELAAEAARNLRRYPNVRVVHADGAAIDPGPLDAVLVNAGFAQPHPAWLTCLKQGGVLVIPLLVGTPSVSGDAIVFRFERTGGQLKAGSNYKAEPIVLVSIFASASLRDDAIQAQLHAAFASERLLRTHSLRLDAHAQDETCIVHAPTFCLSSERVMADQASPGFAERSS